MPPKPKENAMSETTTEAPEAPAALSTKEVAAQLDTTPRRLRKFLRKIGAGVGQGSRYAFDEPTLEQLRVRYAAWLAEQAPKEAPAGPDSEDDPIEPHDPDAGDVVPDDEA